MDTANSWNVGRWRGERGRTRDVPLAACIDPATYRAGFDYGREFALARAARREERGDFGGERRFAPRPDARPTDRRAPRRREAWTPNRGRRAA